MNSSLQSKMETSIATIQKAAKLAQSYTGKPLVVAFSGGKDSQTVYHLAETSKEFPNDPKAFLEWWLSDKSVQEFKSARLPLSEVDAIVDLTFSK